MSKLFFLIKLNPMAQIDIFENNFEKTASYIYSLIIKVFFILLLLEKFHLEVELDVVKNKNSGALVLMKNTTENGKHLVDKKIQNL